MSWPCMRFVAFVFACRCHGQDEASLGKIEILDLNEDANFFANRVRNLQKRETPVSSGADSPERLLACLLIERGNTTDIYNYDKAAAAIDLAVDYVNTYMLPPKFHLDTYYVDIGSDCSAKSHILAYALDLWDRGIQCSVYIGPGCGYASEIVYDMADYLNIPIFGVPAASVGLNAAYTDYSLLIRVSIVYTTLADAFIRFMVHYNYTTPYYLTDSASSTFSEMSTLLRASIQLKAPGIYYTSNYDAVPLATATTERIQQILTNAQRITRVIYIFADAATTRKIMIAADGLKMTNGEYLYVAIELFRSDTWGEFTWQGNDSLNKVARRAYRCLLILSIHQPISDSIDVFEKEVKSRSPKFGYTYGANEKVGLVVSHFFNAVYLYADLVLNMSASGLNYRDGQAMGDISGGFPFMDLPQNRPVKLDENSDLISYYILRNLEPKTGYFEDMFGFPPTSNAIEELGNLNWPAPGGLPKNKPFCGFYGENPACQIASNSDSYAAIILIPIAILAACGTGIGWLYRKYQLTQENPYWWRIFIADIDFSMHISMASKNSKASTQKVDKDKPPQGPYEIRIQLLTFQPGDAMQTAERNLDTLSVMTTVMDRVAMFNHSPVGIRKLAEPWHRMSATGRSELMMVRRLDHVNVQKIVGVGINEDSCCVCIVSESCQKGSLQDLIEKTSMDLNWVFKYSLIKDLVNGMAYLHTTPVRSHGRLSALSCLIDSRFMMKISDFGLWSFRGPEELAPPHSSQTERDFYMLLWRAPELLRREMDPAGSQKGDVYSFAIILQQLILRSHPFKVAGRAENKRAQLNAKEIVLEVQRGAVPALRPPVPPSACKPQLHELMEECWEENQLLRPPFIRIKASLFRVIGKEEQNIIDHLVKFMEDYANALQIQVEKKTAQFVEEKRRSDQLLARLLPKSVAAQLAKGSLVFPELYESTTVYFSDVDGFSEIVTDGHTPHEIVDSLNLLYTTMDAVIDSKDAYKVETINDAYLVVSGLPNVNGKKHAEEIGVMALDLRRIISNLKFKHVADTTRKIQLRIGISSGACVGGIVGSKLPRYCVFGDTVNTAARMESHGEPGKIHVSQSTQILMEAHGGFILISRGAIAIKGKGHLETYWLAGRS